MGCLMLTMRVGYDDQSINHRPSCVASTKKQPASRHRRSPALTDFSVFSFGTGEDSTLLLKEATLDMEKDMVVSYRGLTVVEKEATGV